MMSKRCIVLVITIAIFEFCYADQSVHIGSPDGNLQLTLNSRDNGTLLYTVAYKGKTVVAPSGFGFKLSNPDLSLVQFNLMKVDSSAVDQSWKPVWGEQSSIRNNYKQLILKLTDHASSGITINMIFRLFNNGLGFRYEFPQQSALSYFIVAQELTEFAMTGDHKVFWIPGDYDSNEFAYYTTKLSEIDATNGGPCPGNCRQDFF